ncbi:hypothetical protein G5714_021849 [Onychostoma macrolepis]|uniref:Uncharacterized protein n=1 Tax=Onychostoma macrolepis TaxID=369639 RepID=A0A7J6BSW4_9TELE|nr:hypothetical protein G5714_021849 [Onychostoma macrolepis]
MAPVSACHRLLPCLLVWLFIWFSNCGALVVCDRQSLLDIRSTFSNSYNSDVECVFNKPYGSVTTDILECIRCWPLSNPRMKRRRKHGSRGGRTIKLKACLHVGCIPSPFCEPSYAVHGLASPGSGSSMASTCSSPVPALRPLGWPSLDRPSSELAPGVLQPLRKTTVSTLLSSSPGTHADPQSDTGNTYTPPLPLLASPATPWTCEDWWQGVCTGAQTQSPLTTCLINTVGRRTSSGACSNGPQFLY